MPKHDRREVQVDTGAIRLDGTLTVPQGGHGVVVFAHGSGSSRRSRRNLFVAEILNQRGLGTLLFDLLSPEEGRLDERTSELRFNVDLLGERLKSVVDWVARQPQTMGMRIGLFGSSTGAAAALMAASQRPIHVRAVVSRGGRPDLAGDALASVLAPTLLIVGGRDEEVILLNEKAGHQMRAPHELQIVPGASHLFEEPGKLEAVATLASDWFWTYLRPQQPLEGHVEAHGAR